MNRRQAEWFWYDLLKITSYFFPYFMLMVLLIMAVLFLISPEVYEALSISIEGMAKQVGTS